MLIKVLIPTKENDTGDININKLRDQNFLLIESVTYDVDNNFN